MPSKLMEFTGPIYCIWQDLSEGMNDFFFISLNGRPIFTPNKDYNIFRGLCCLTLSISPYFPNVPPQTFHDSNARNMGICIFSKKG